MYYDSSLQPINKACNSKHRRGIFYNFNSSGI